MKLVLVDVDEDVVDAWRRAFSSFPEVEAVGGDILAVADDAVVSPANGYGFMDGGIDLEYCEFFGERLQIKVRDAISRRPEGMLPVGAGLAVETEHPKIPWLIVAPTMEMPMPVSSVNCYHAMVAVLRTAARYAGRIETVYCPGLGTGTGRVTPQDAAEEMASAYRDWKRKSAVQ